MSIKGVKAELKPLRYTEHKEIAQVKSVLGIMPLACIIQDVEFKTIYWNDKATKLFGYTFEQVKGKNLFEILFKDDSKRHLSFLVNNLEKGLSFSERKENVRAGENESIICEWTYTPFYSKDNVFIGVICTVQDITDRVQNKNLLKEQNYILEMIASGISLTEVLHSIIKFMEQESKRVLGSVLILDREGKKLNVAAGPHLPEEYNKMVDGLEVGLLNGSCGTAAFKKEMVIVEDTTKDENWIKYKDVAIKFGLMACTSIPILDSKKELLGTFAFYYLEPSVPSAYEFKMINAASSLAGIAIERDKIQNALKEKEVLHKLITENVNIFITITDMVGKFIYSSSSFNYLLGINNEMKSDMHFQDFIYKDDLEDFNIIFQRTIEGAGKTEMSTLRLVDPTGSFHWVESWQKLISRDENKYLLGVGIEITERKLAEENQKLLTRELIRQNEYLQQFSYITSHNLRAPISNILGLVSLINLNPENGYDPVILENLQQAAVNLDNVIKDLSSLISIKTGIQENKEKILFKNFFNSIIKNLEKQIEFSNAEITADFSKAPEIYSISSYVQSILSNLMENAIKYRSPKRKLKIKLESFSNDQYIALSICDNGLGIDLERQGSKVFGLYKRFHSHVEGKGLGLHIVKTQIETIGGSITLESQIDGGTCFHLLFPK